jgi:formate hydrogenlyase subunit 3/multisubunit Na+/H+ antiporter MnhD subunit
VTLLLVAIGVLLASGALACTVSRARALASAIGAAGALGACALALVPTLRALFGGAPESMRAPWGVPIGAFVVEIDALSAFFLVPIFVLGGLAAVYGRAYVQGADAKKSLGPSIFAFNVLVASMALVVIARNGVLFLVAWEVMALSAYVLVTFDHEHADVRRAGWVYLVATHIGTAAIIGMFVLLARGAGTYDFAAFYAAAPLRAGTALVVFVLAVIGFGAKAGLVPLHVWLPEAHAAAPSHVSAVMSGVMLKMGIYGIVRTLSILGPARSWWGPTLMILGLLSATLGIALALYQRDMKRALAYSSVENIGLVTLGLGLGYWGAASGRPGIATLGAAGGLLHVWNHTLMKGAMFLGAGSILHSTGTRNLERLGGLLPRMPRTGAAMIAGAVAISGLPPMNGFVSEWLLYLGLIRGGGVSSGVGGAPSVAVLLATGLVSLVGAMAAVCFLRLVGIALLGEPRSAEARGAHENSAWLTAPMGMLIVASAAIAIFPAPVVVAVARAGRSIRGDAAPSLPDAPLATLGEVNSVLWGSIFVAWGLFAWLRRGKPVARDVTWGCGYVAATPRMQYTARAFAELFGATLLPDRLRPRFSQLAPKGTFPEPGSFASTCDDPLTRDMYDPFFASVGDRFARLRWLQQGVLHVYILYILVVLVLALAWVSFRVWSGA